MLRGSRAMPRKNFSCGIYIIKTPRGSVYVGSSYKIEQRWAEHKSALKYSRHHSPRLQKAWDKYGVRLSFEIIDICERHELSKKEQWWIESLRPALNACASAINVWDDASVRAKLSKVHSSKEWSDARSAIAMKQTWRWVPVDCSDGRSFDSLSQAARAFGIRAGGIKHLVETQARGRLGVRFKLASESWRVIPAKPEPRSKRKRIDVRVPVIATPIGGGIDVAYPSQRDAARAVGGGNYRTASAQICKAIKGVKRNAYGFEWRAA